MEEPNIYQDAINNIKRIKQSDASETFWEKSKLAIRGSATGLVLGLMYGWYFKKNIYFMAVIGAISGGVINYFYIENIKK